MNFLVDLILRIYTGIALLFKKKVETISSTQDIEKVVVQEKQDTYFAETMNKSYRQLMYEQTAKKYDLDQNQYPQLNWEESYKRKAAKK